VFPTKFYTCPKTYSREAAPYKCFPTSRNWLEGQETRPSAWLFKPLCRCALVPQRICFGPHSTHESTHAKRPGIPWGFLVHSTREGRT
jgi:hypothetical protein